MPRSGTIKAAGTILIKEPLLEALEGLISNGDAFQTKEVFGLEVHVKDSRHFKVGWAYFVHSDGQDMAFAALGLLARVITPWPATFRGFDALAVDHPGAGRGLATCCFAPDQQQGIREHYSLSLGSYARPRMTMELKESGLVVGERCVGRLIRMNGSVGGDSAGGTIQSRARFERVGTR